MKICIQNQLNNNLVCKKEETKFNNIIKQNKNV